MMTTIGDLIKVLQEHDPKAGVQSLDGCLYLDTKGGIIMRLHGVHPVREQELIHIRDAKQLASYIHDIEDVLGIDGMSDDEPIATRVEYVKTEVGGLYRDIERLRECVNDIANVVNKYDDDQERRIDDEVDGCFECGDGLSADTRIDSGDRAYCSQKCFENANGEEDN